MVDCRKMFFAFAAVALLSGLTVPADANIPPLHSIGLPSSPIVSSPTLPVFGKDANRAIEDSQLGNLFSSFGTLPVPETLGPSLPARPQCNLIFPYVSINGDGGFTEFVLGDPEYNFILITDFYRGHGFMTSILLVPAWMGPPPFLGNQLNPEDQPLILPDEVQQGQDQSNAKLAVARRDTPFYQLDLV